MIKNKNIIITSIGLLPPLFFTFPNTIGSLLFIFTLSFSKRIITKKKEEFNCV